MAGNVELVEKPVVERAVVLELQRAQRMGHAFDGIRETLGEVVHRVDAPRITRHLVALVADAVDHRIAHVEVGRRHVDLGAQHVLAVGELAGAHALEQGAVLGDGARTVGAVATRFRQGSPVGAHILGAQAAHVRLALVDQFKGEFVQPLEVVRRMTQVSLEAVAEPCDVLLDGLDVLQALLRRVRVVEAQVARTAVVLGDAEIETDRLGVADVQVAVGLGGKARHHAAAVLAGGHIRVDDLADEVRRRCRGAGCLVHAGLGPGCGRECGFRRCRHRPSAASPRGRRSAAARSARLLAGTCARGTCRCARVACARQRRSRRGECRCSGDSAARP